MITPLKKHPGQHGGLIALTVLIATTAVVVTSRPSKAPPPPPEPSAPVASLAGVATAVAPTPQVETAKAVTVIVDPHAPMVVRGTTDYDDTRTSRVSVPVSGWLKKARAKSLGRTVRAGEALGTIYSADVLVASAAVIDQVRNFRDQASLDAERWRLFRWGMQQAVLSRIEQTQKPQAALPLVSRVTGTVVAEAGEPAQPFDAASGPTLFTITDPAYSWVFVDVPEAYATTLADGTSATLTIEGLARPVPAKVAHVYRHAEDGMRKVRFDVYSPRMAIKPNLAVKAELPPVAHLALP